MLKFLQRHDDQFSKAVKWMLSKGKLGHAAAALLLIPYIIIVFFHLVLAFGWPKEMKKDG